MSTFYNDNDVKACLWLRELADAGQISKGTVCEKSIADIAADDLRGFRRVHLFAGIGGWDYALQLADWPDDREVWTGSCPCQPYSVAGKGCGESDPRDLWPQMFRLIREFRPATVFGEQVANAIGHGWLDRICADLEAEGYAVGSAVLGAHSVGAPHIRQRLFWVADACSNGCRSRRAERARQQGEITRVCIGRRMEHTDGAGRGEQCRAIAEPEEQPGVERAGDVGWISDTEGKRRDGMVPWCESIIGERPRTWSDCTIVHCTDGKARRIESGLSPLADGFPGRVGLLRGYGNAIVPQVAAEFVRAFMSVSRKELTGE